MNNVYFRMVAKIRTKATIDRAIVVDRVKVKNELVIALKIWLAADPIRYRKSTLVWLLYSSLSWEI